MFESKLLGYEELSASLSKSATDRRVREPHGDIVLIDQEGEDGSVTVGYLGQTIYPTDREEVDAYNSLRSAALGGVPIPSEPFTATLGFVSQTSAEELFDAIPGGELLRLSGLDLVRWSIEARSTVIVYWPDWEFTIYNIQNRGNSTSNPFESPEIEMDVIEAMNGLRES